MTNKVVMSGMRPTGKLHLGHYLGVLTNWKKFQEQYDCYFSIANWHALTTNYNNVSNLQENVYEVLKDWLASGIDPNKSTIFLQSMLPEVAILHVYLSMMCPHNWVERDPTLKDMVKIIKSKEGQIEATYGLIGYPILMCADIMSLNADYVPVGKDQLPHIEIARDIVRRFNNLYGTDFTEPKGILNEVKLLAGLDGNKMGKSFNNDIKLSDTPEETAKKIMTGITDRNRIRKDDKGDPNNCEVIYKYWEIFAADTPKLQEIQDACRGAQIGCMQCKRMLAELVNNELAPIRDRRAQYENNPDVLKDILIEGAKKAGERARLVMDKVEFAIKSF